MGRYILILDADTEMVYRDLNELIPYMDPHVDLGIPGHTIVSENNAEHSSTKTYTGPIPVVLRRRSPWLALCVTAKY